jgi:hypothetical protein
MDKYHFPRTLRDDLRKGSIYLSAVAGLFRFTTAEMEQARAWVKNYPKLLVAGALDGKPIDADPENPLLVLESGMRLGQIVCEDRDLLLAAQRTAA